MAKQFVDDAIKDNKVAVFSKTYCPFCKMAKAALKEAGLTTYFLAELDERGSPSCLFVHLNSSPSIANGIMISP